MDVESVVFFPVNGFRKIQGYAYYGRRRDLKPSPISAESIPLMRQINLNFQKNTVPIPGKFGKNPLDHRIHIPNKENDRVGKDGQGYGDYE